MTRPRPPISERQVRQIVTLGKRHAKAAFPNPDQKDCPDPSVLRAMAYRDKRLSVTPLPVSHVASCSPCFCEYSRQRRNARVLRAFQVTVGGLMAAALLLVAAFLVRDHVLNRERSITVQQKSSAQPSAPEVPRSTQGADPDGPFAMIVDLSPFSPVRSEQTKPTGHIDLPAKLLRVTFLMPIGSEPGEYRVRLTKQKNEVVADLLSVAHFRDAVTSLEVPLDLQSMAGERLTLMIKPSGRSWREFPVEIAKR